MRVFLLLLSASHSGGQTGARCLNWCACNSENSFYSSMCPMVHNSECVQGSFDFSDCGNCAGCGASSTGDPHL
eukprot:6669682-Prymnesium_polylepis.1